MQPRKPLWTEGLFIMPQHFQEADRYHERYVDMRLHGLANYPWGLRSVSIDERALAGGTLRVLVAHGIFSDGAVFTIGDGGEDAVEPRALEGQFPPSLPELDVYLAQPVERDAAANVAGDGTRPAPNVRYVPESMTVHDTTTGRSEATVIWARSHLRVVMGNEPREGLETLRIAKVVRDAAGGFILKRTYVPPSVHIGGNPYLREELRRLLGAVVGRQKSLAEGRRLRTDASVDFQASDTAKFWLLHTLNAFIPKMSHAVEEGSQHPEQLYELLGSLIAQLCTFSADGDPTSIPKYNHLELDSVFVPMFDRANALVTGSLAETFIVVPMEKRDDGMYLAKLEDPRVLRAHAFYLEASGGDEATLRERLPRLLKIGSWTQVSYILNAAMPGVKTSVEYRPPGAIPVKPGLVYLKVDTNGDYWNDIVTSGTVAIYQPVDPQKISLRLIGVPLAEANRPRK